MNKSKDENTNIYIHQLKAEKYLQLHDDNDIKNISFGDLKLNFQSSLPDSLTMRYMKKKYPDRFVVHKKPFLNTNGKTEYINYVRTTAIIDVTFKKNHRKLSDNPVHAYKNGKRITYKNSYGEIVTRKKDIRNKIYSEGFTIDGVKYSLFARSSSKSRLSQCLFIEDSILEDVQQWGRMGLEFTENEKCDLASLMAYESLTLSGIIGTLNIKPCEILLMDDRESRFISKASVTEYDETTNKLVVSERDEKQTSDIYDGQSLLDSSKFTGSFEGKGCILLRNKFFKSCAFNTNIQMFFKDKGITDISQVKGITLAKSISDIKYIITPNSLKALKFAYKLNFAVEKEKEGMFKYWLLHIDHNYGVCKFEKASPFGEYHQTSYQMLNSLPIDYKAALDLASTSIKQINNINSDFESFKKYLKVCDSVNVSRELLYNICCINSDVQHTEMYKEKRREIIKYLKMRMRKGKLLITGDYAIIISNPIEMLKDACGIKWLSSIHRPYEMHTMMFEEGDELVGFRNPNVAAGNVCVLTNRRKKTISTYLNLTKNICVINSYKNDILARLQGADMDSDMCLIVKNSTCLDAAKECQKFLTPLNRIKLNTQKREYNKSEMSNIDYIVGENLIGRIINLSQLFNSYYWDYKSKGATDDQLQTIYDCISMCSSLSQMEIDKAKKFFTIDVKHQINKISNSVFNSDELEELLENKRMYAKKKKHLEKMLEKLSNNDINASNQEKKKINIEKEKKNKRDYIDVCKAEAETLTNIKNFLEKNRIIRLSEIQPKMVLLTETESNTIDEYEKALENKDITKEHYDKLVSDLLRMPKPKLKQIKPQFYKNNSKDRDCEFVYFNTPMDYLTAIVDDKKIIPKAPADKRCMQIEDLIVSNRKGVDPDRKQVDKIETIAKQVQKNLKACYSNNAKKDRFDYKKYMCEKDQILCDAINKAKKVKISKPETILLLLRRCYSKNKKVKKKSAAKNRTTILNLLYKAHTEMFINCFKKST